MYKLYYKDFIWPQNPAVYQVHYLRKATYGKDDAGETVFQGLGGLKQTISGSGVFTGETAYEDFKALAALCSQDQAWPLVHPVWGRVSAFLTELKMEQESRDHYVAYSFIFQVADEDGGIPQ